MNIIKLSITFIMLLFIFQSCQKENIEDVNSINSLSDLELIEKRAGSSKGNNSGVQECYKLLGYTDPMTVTWAEYQYIIEQLVNPGISLINCDQVFYSFDENFNGGLYETKLMENIVETTHPNGYTTFYIEPFQLLCFGCIGNYDFCSAEGLRIVKGSGANNCTLSIVNLEFESDQLVKLNLASYFDVALCNMVICDDSGGE